MNSSIAAGLFRSALWIALAAGGPLLAALTVTAIVFGILQAATQVQDSAVSFTPKLAVALIVTWLTAAWFSSMLTGFMHQALTAIPAMVTR